MCGASLRLIILAPMGPQAAQCLSPELVLVLPPAEAAAARRSLPEPPWVSTSLIRQAAPSSRSRTRRAAGLAAVYAGVVAVTVTPLALMMKAVPSGHHGIAPQASLQVDHNLRTERHHPH